MPPSSCIVDSATELTPTVAGANRRAATTQYSSPTAEVSPELSTSASPSRATGLILPRRSAGPTRSRAGRPAGRRHLLVHPHPARLSNTDCAPAPARWQHRRMPQTSAGPRPRAGRPRRRPDRTVHRGHLAARGLGRHAGRRRPRHRQDARRGGERRPRRRAGRPRRRRRRAARFRRAAAARARGDPAPRLRTDHVPGRRPRPAHDAGDGQAAGRVEGRGRLRRGVLPLVRRGGRAHRRAVRGGPERREPLPGHAPARRRLPAGHARGTSPWPWAPARSVLPSPPAAPWSSSPRSRPRCRCTPSPRSSPRRACPTACSTS